MTIAEYGLLTHFDADTSFVSMLDLTAGTLVIETGSRIDVTGRGYLGGKGYDESGRTIGNVSGSSQGSGGSYAGLGGSHNGGTPQCPVWQPDRSG